MRDYIIVFVTNEDETISIEVEAVEIYYAYLQARDHRDRIEYENDVSVVGYTVCPK